MKGRFLFYSIFFLAAIFSCSEGEEAATINYYYWRAQGTIDQPTAQYLAESNSQKLYMRFFDVHYIDNEAQKGPFPVSISQVTLGQIPEGVAVVPVVYIENDVFTKSLDNELEALSEHVNQEIQDIFKEKGVSSEPSEIQIDCDWTERSRESYFTFLLDLKKIGTYELSTTIRLHQVKYASSTGVPPADYGVLMFYNMGDVTSMQERNSILNLEEAEKYLSGAEGYPLQLVPAYPSFSWGVLFRKNEAIALLNNTDLSLFESQLFQKDAAGHYNCQERCFIDGKWLYEGDMVRFETVDTDLLLQAEQLVGRYLGPQKECIVYHLNVDLMTRMSTQDLKDIFQ